MALKFNRVVIGIAFVLTCWAAYPAAASGSDDDLNSDGIYDEVEDSPNKAKLWLRFGAYYPQLNTKASLSRSDGTVGTTIDFESDLGMDDAEFMPVISASYRFNSSHRINFSYFDLNRRGGDESKVRIRFGDEVFEAFVPVQSFFDVEAFSVAYGYSLYTDSTKDLELSVGLSVQDLAFGLASTDDGKPIAEETGITAPLPTLGLSGFYSLGNKFLLQGRIGYFAVDLNWEDSDREFGGHIFDASLGIYHKTFRNIGFGLDWSYFDVNVHYSKNGRDARGDYTYNGPRFNVVAFY